MTNIGDFDSIEKQIVDAARGYVGVAYRHQGRSRAGLDCLGLLVRVSYDCGFMLNGRLIGAHDETGYGHYPDEVRLRRGLGAVLVPRKELSLGAVLLLRHDGAARHLGIVGDYASSGDYSLIHAYAPARMVVEHRLDASWRARIAAIYGVREMYNSA